MLAWEFFNRDPDGLCWPPRFTAAPASVIGLFSIWDNSFTPAVPLTNDPNPIELGVKFQADIPGNVIGVKFYKGGLANGGIHVGNLWNSVGLNLGTVNFTGETASGWQQQLFPGPIPILANTTYIISYFAPLGFYSSTSAYFAITGHDNPPLHALSDAVASGNGVFLPNGGFPNQTFNATNYWVDLIFQV